TEPSPGQTEPIPPADAAGPAGTALGAAGIDRDNWQAPDNIRWSFQNVARVLPTTPISRGTGPVAELPVELQDLGEVEIPATEHSGARSVRSVIEATDTDGWMLLHNGTALIEEYFGAMTPSTAHLLMSVSKSLVSTVAGVLAGSGDLDPGRPMTDYGADRADARYAGAPVRNTLVVRARIRFSEGYPHPESEDRQLDEAIGGSDAARVSPGAGMYEFLTTLEAKSEH